MKKTANRNGTTLPLKKKLVKMLHTKGKENIGEFSVVSVTKKRS